MPRNNLKEFSRLAQNQASRNIVNMSELDGWLDKLAQGKLGDGERDEKARRWVATVARKRMAREGEVVEVGADEARQIATEQPWAAKAIDAGLPIHKLAMSTGEAEELSRVLDWMRSDDGPAMGSDWSRISWPQASHAHEAWIEAMAKAARKRMFEQAAFAGCEFAASVEGVAGLEGWSWVEVKTAQALEREGALMRHCVGSYARDVAWGRVAIWSLRDPKGKPALTVETKTREVGQFAVGRAERQIKAFGNERAPLETAPALASLFGFFESQGRPLVESSPDLEAVNKTLLEQDAPRAFVRGKLWSGEGGDGKAGEFEQACLAVLEEGDRIETLTALDLALARKQLDLAARLVGGMGDSDQPWSEREESISRRAREAGCVIERGNAHKSIESKLWRPGQEEEAMARVAADPSACNPALEISARLGFFKAVEAGLERMGNQEAFKACCGLIPLGAPCEAGVRVGQDVKQLETLWTSALSAGALGVAKKVAASLRDKGSVSSPAAGVDGEIRLGVLEHLEKSVQAIVTDPELARALRSNEGEERLENSKPFRLWRDNLERCESWTVRAVVALFAKSSAGAGAEDIEMVEGQMRWRSEINRSVARFLVKNFTPDQREALIQGMINFAFFKDSPDVLSRLAKRRGGQASERPRRFGPL